jgi:predicted ATPase
MTKLPISKIRIRNFKAIRDSGVVEFTPLTVFIGDNGVGKSSLIEALETWQQIASNGLNEALVPWLSFESIWNKAAQAKRDPTAKVNQMYFEIRGHWKQSTYDAQTTVSKRLGSLEVSIADDVITIKNKLAGKRILKQIFSPPGSYEQDNNGTKEILPAALGDRSLLALEPVGLVSSWHFASVLPEVMGIPTAQKRTQGLVVLSKNGSNIADYLRDIARLDLANSTNVYTEIVAAMREVLPYASNLQPVSTDTIQRSLHLGLTESNFQIEGWMLSTGTMRALSILALLRHPYPPAVIFIEELEDGLSPRTLTMVAREICAAVKAGKTQVVISTQSPYLLDLVSLDQIVLVERENGEPIFKRPSAEKFREWGVNFTPGQLYAMGLIRGGETNGVEFKVAAIFNTHTSRKDPAMMENIIKGVAAFLNHENGGVLVIGVDNNSNIIGLGSDEFTAANSQRADADTYELFLRSKLSSALRIDDILGLLRIRFEVVGKTVCVIHIKASHRAVYWNDDLCVRVGNQSKKLNPRAASEYSRKRWPA